MGKIKHLAEVRKMFEKTPVVSTRDVSIIVKNKNYSYQIVNNLARRGEIKRITKGFYTRYEDPAVSVFCFKPSYIGLQEALSIHNLWEQETSVVIITAKKVKKNIIKVFGNNVILHRIKPKYIFGYELMKYGDFHIPVSDLEKTLIDLVYFNSIPDRIVLKGLRRRIELQKLEGYLRAYPEKTKKKVLSLVQ